ncbi:MAG TPA: TGS domain-containing protein, partial [Gammaproteobacteria bacterium]|nr:TGS domain-containing protein [Gammaproteobacteria bacterium]
MNIINTLQANINKTRNQAQIDRLRKTFLAERRVIREQRIQETTARLKEQLDKSHIKSDLSGRVKHIYSIYLKMQRKHADYKNIYDYSAVRILVPTIEDCYTALSIAHQLWEHIPEEFDDYISHPKPNGYRSIHTAVIGSDGKNLEIQIRTYAMHEESEHGIAAHWLYKENKTHQSGYEAKITFLRQLLAWHKEVATQNEKPDNRFNEDTVYVFTPAGDILDLPLGATPLDFAYCIHSGLGHRCRGAKVNGHIVPLTYVLRTGDQIEILTTPRGAPSRDWANKEFRFLKTSRARQKVLQWFKHQDTTPPPPVDPSKKRIQKIKKSTTSLLPKKEESVIPRIQIAGIPDLLTRIAKCCCPIPTTEIVGYITQGRGISIHKKNCRNLTHLTKNRNNRLIQVRWDNKPLVTRKK